MNNYYYSLIFALLGFVLLFKPEFLISSDSENVLLKPLSDNSKLIGLLSILIAFYFYPNSKMYVKSLTDSVYSSNRTPSYQETITDLTLTN